jgi:spore germination protein GerM
MKYIKIIILALVFALSFVASGCGVRRPTSENGKPIEPLAPGVENPQMQTLEGHFSVKSSDVQIQDLSVTSNGELTVVGTIARSVYLLERGGKLRWERVLDSVPLQTYINATGSRILVGTAGGQLLSLDPDQAMLESMPVLHEFDAPVSLLSVSGDGELILAGIQTENEQQADKVVLLGKSGIQQWELVVDKLLDARIVGPDNQVYVNWIDNEGPVFAAFSPAGEKRWEVRDRVLFAVDDRAKTLVSTDGSEIFGNNNEADMQWRYYTSGTVTKVLLADSGSHLGALMVDESTRNEEFFYLNAEGKELWRKRLPTDSEILVSPDGSRVIVASWRQYRDDATQILIYNDRGEEVNVLEVSGRAQRMALASKESVLVLGLEDGTIYFLNVSDPVRSGQSREERTLREYYSPVNFDRDEGESRLTLFFFDDEAQSLIPVTRRVKRTKSLLRASIDELIRGPVQGSFLHRTIPKDEEIRVESNEGVVQIDLPASLNEMAGSTFLTGVLDSLLMTVSQFPTIHQVVFTVEGNPTETFGREGLLIDEPYSPQRFGRKEGERLVYLPARSGDKFYLRTQTKPFVSLKDRALIETLVRYVLEQSQPFFRQELELQDVRIENNRVQLDFSESFNRIISDNTEAAARVAMLRDALTLTIAENTYYSNFDILVRGNPPRSPEIYLPWEVSITKPYYVNPEN